MDRPRRLLSWILAALGLTATASAEPPRFAEMAVLGDSLSDIGNAGRFSNGPVWVERLADRLGATLAASDRGGLNFAVGGARLDPRSGPSNLRAQADRFLKAPAPSGRRLAIVWGGGNDLLAAVGHPDGARMVEAAAASLRSIVADLIARRAARDILVPNLPDVGMTPAIRAHGEGAVAEARRLTERFNRAVDHALAEIVGSAPPSVRIRRLDVWAMAERARADPAAFGFADIATPCGGLSGCDGYLFWDRVHPTTAAHRRLADEAFRILAQAADR